MKFKVGDLLLPNVIYSDKCTLILECHLTNEQSYDDWYVVLNSEQITRWNALYVENLYEKIT